MNPLPEPPEGFRLAENGETYSPSELNGYTMARVWFPWKACWLRWPVISESDWKRPWFNGNQMQFAVPVEVSDG